MTDIQMDTVPKCKFKVQNQPPTSVQSAKSALWKRKNGKRNGYWTFIEARLQRCLRRFHRLTTVWSHDDKTLVSG